MDRYAEIDDEVDVEQCSDSEAVRNNTRRTAQTSLASPACASDDERSTPEQISVSKSFASNVATVVIIHLIFNIFVNFYCSFSPCVVLQAKSRLTDSCNCDDLSPVQCHLETKELWDKFHELGTEMIITKTGR